jgi:putative endonuclease
MKTHEYCVYIMTNKHNTTLYTGVTNKLKKRNFEHKEHLIKGFTDRYNLEKLVYFEVTSDINVAIFREKQIKNWSRRKKNELIESINPEWNDLVEDLFV